MNKPNVLSFVRLGEARRVLGTNTNRNLVRDLRRLSDVDKRAIAELIEEELRKHG